MKKFSQNLKIRNVIFIINIFYYTLQNSIIYIIKYFNEIYFFAVLKIKDMNDLCISYLNFNHLLYNLLFTFT